MGEIARPSLAEFVRYLPPVQQLGLTDDDLQAIPVHAEPPPDEDFLSLGELPPGAPPLETGGFPFVGTRQLYVCRADVSSQLWQRLAVGLEPHHASGSPRPGMFGNAEEQVVDSENPAQSWRVLNAGEPYRPPEL